CWPFPRSGPVATGPPAGIWYRVSTMAKRKRPSPSEQPGDPQPRWEDVPANIRERVEARLAEFQPLAPGEQRTEHDPRASLDLSFYRLDPHACVALVRERLRH